MWNLLLPYGIAYAFCGMDREMRGYAEDFQSKDY
jgi:hypothetical protein